ncbi:MAG: glycosyltransferase [Acidobacteriaceae bacterium]|nr:glycosyltransferase [Acidobacteriaceae bacterium]
MSSHESLETPNRVLDTQIESATDQNRQLRAELRVVQRQLARALEMLEHQQTQLAAHDTSIARLDRILMELLTGRLWRTLRAAGQMVARFLPTPAGSEEAAVVRGRHNSFLVCDEPKATDLRPRSGLVIVRGWCLAEHGVDAVQIEVPGLPIIETKPVLPRPDVRRMRPDLDRTGRAGFSAEFDSTQLRTGRHTVSLRVISRNEVVATHKTAINIDHVKGYSSDYDRWIHEFERPEDEIIELKLLSLAYRPLISILMPVFNTDPAELRAAIESILNQSYSNWELCIADDCSSRAEIREILEGFSAQDERIKVAFQQQRGGISRACNAAWELAKGDYVCFVDHDDTLAPHALAYVCEALNRDPEGDLLYSDEDKIDARGRRFEPFFKPDWSPDLLLSENYICHLLVIRSELAAKVGRLNPDFDGSQDYDLILRATAQANRILHIPRVLYHWRASADSTASTIENKEYALEAAQRALTSYCRQIGREISVEPGRVTGRWRIHYPIPESTRVSIIIAAGGKVDILRTNLDSLFSRTTYAHFEVVVIDNSKVNSIENLVREFQGSRANLRYIDWRNKPFNYSVINNAAAKQCDSPVLLFLNDDTSVIEPQWLEAMLELVMRPEVGAVGARLLYPDGRIQHAGVVMGIYDNCGHAFKGLEGSVSHHFDFPDVIRNVSAITGACFMARAEIFWQAGGFDENEFAVAFNDIDLSLKISNLGYRVLYTPHAELYHHEAFSKTSKDLVPHPVEVESMRLKWGKVISADPYYNPNLTRNDEDYSLRTRNQA